MAPSRDIVQQSAAALSGDTRHDCRSGSCRSFSSSDLTLREFKSLYSLLLSAVLFFYIYCGGGRLKSAAVAVVAAQCSEKWKNSAIIVHIP